MALSDIEYNPFVDQYNILFFERDGHGTYRQGYIGELNKDQIINAQPIDSKAYNFLRSYKSLESMGFTEKAMEWSGLHDSGYTNDEILSLRDRNFDMRSFLQIAEKIVK